MTVTIPTGVVADGKTAVWWVPTGGIADVTAPSQAEMRAGTVVNITGFLTSDGLNTGSDQQTISDERLSTTQSFAQPGRYTETLTIKYVYDQQAAPGAADNYVYETLKRATQGWIVIRTGIAYDTDPTDGDVVDVYPATCGFQNKLPPEANSMLKVEQQIYVSNAVQHDVTIGGVS